MANRCVVPGCGTRDSNSTLVKRSVFKVPTDKIILLNTTNICYPRQYEKRSIIGFTLLWVQKLIYLHYTFFQRFRLSLVKNARALPWFPDRCIAWWSFAEVGDVNHNWRHPHHSKNLLVVRPVCKTVPHIFPSRGLCPWPTSCPSWEYHCTRHLIFNCFDSCSIGVLMFSYIYFCSFTQVIRILMSILAQ